MAAGLDAMLVTTPGVCGGRIRIEGTRITVHRIATLYKQGQGPEDIARTYPHLSLSQVYAAGVLPRQSSSDRIGVGRRRCPIR